MNDGIILQLFVTEYDKNNKMTSAPSKDSDQPGKPPNRSESSLCPYWVAKDQGWFMRTANILIRQGGCPGWSESSLGAHSFCWFCHDLSRRWTHRSICWFCPALANYVLLTSKTKLVCVSNCLHTAASPLFSYHTNSCLKVHSSHLKNKYEPPHDKSNKMAVRPAKTQIILGIRRPGWSESSLSAWRKLGSLATHWAHSEDSGCSSWPESSLGAQSFCWFCHEAAHISNQHPL